MARTNDVNSATSQFFINVELNGSLDHKGKEDSRTWGYAVFGRVIDGMDVVDDIRFVETGPDDVPIEAGYHRICRSSLINQPSANDHPIHLRPAPGRPATGDDRLAVRVSAGRGLNADALYILGDLFEFWLGDDVPSKCSVEVASALPGFEKGVPCYFMHGNRDFLLQEDYAKSAGMTFCQKST